MRVPKEGRLDFFKELYDNAKASLEESFDMLDRHYKQYRGDPSIDPIEESLEEREAARASVVRNITYELIESQVTTYIPTPKCESETMGDRGAKNAISVETMLRALRNKLPMEELNDLCERYTYIYGGSVWLVEWDESLKTHNTVGGIKLSVISPRRFVGQPYIYRIEDMEYCFVEFETTKEDLVRKYGVLFNSAEETVNDENPDEDTATMYICYYKDDDDRICQYIWSGDIELRDLENYYSRKREYCLRCGKKKQICECEKPEYETRDEEYEQLDNDIVLSDGASIIPGRMPVFDSEGFPVLEDVKMPIMDQAGQELFAFDEKSGLTLPMTEIRQVQKTEPTRIPFYTPKSFPIVIRKNTSRESSVLGQSDCEFIRPQQQAINKVESRIMRKLMRSGVTPCIPEEADITLNNSVFGQVIRLRPGERGQYGVIDTQPNISIDVLEADRLYDQAKRILGISESFQGHYDPSAKSGIAKQTQAMQSSGRLDSKRKMKNYAYSELDRRIFELLLAFADEPRPVAYRDTFGRVQETRFSRYDFLLLDENNRWYYDDEYMFSTDASEDIAGDRFTLWQENRVNFEKGAYGDPQDPKVQLVFWLNQQKAHYPFAQENVDRLRELIEEQAKMEQMAERIKALEGELGNREKYSNQLYETAVEQEQELIKRRKYDNYVAEEIKKINGGNL